ncbi:hypothetical protein B1207_08005 [Legionella quinlivanii]|uniref:Uncharacterized protein n=1 Tax=Legionella quinlivanii TaxID=45073 RepID=A0A364LJM6_9GAMM|nr:hypothetical protein [Legionella quinlivanii]RAP36733.1 hypothetical protein B1207_08005 [Legionella quinlivanii]
MKAKLETTAVTAFKKAVAEGDLKQCQDILANYASYEKELITALKSSELLKLKELTRYTSQFDGVTSVPFPPETAADYFKETEEYYYVVDEKYAERFKKIPPEASFVECFNLINSLRVKYGFPSYANKSEDRIIPERWPWNHPEIDWDMANYSYTCIIKGTRSAAPARTPPASPILENDIERQFLNSTTHWPVQRSEQETRARAFFEEFVRKALSGRKIEDKKEPDDLSPAQNANQLK